MKVFSFSFSFIFDQPPPPPVTATTTIAAHHRSNCCCCHHHQPLTTTALTSTAAVAATTTIATSNVPLLPPSLLHHHGRRHYCHLLPHHRRWQWLPSMVAGTSVMIKMFNNDLTSNVISQICYLRVKAMLSGYAIRSTNKEIQELRLWLNPRYLFHKYCGGDPPPNIRLEIER